MLQSEQYLTIGPDTIFPSKVNGNNRSSFSRKMILKICQGYVYTNGTLFLNLLVLLNVFSVIDYPIVYITLLSGCIISLFHSVSFQFKQFSNKADVTKHFPKISDCIFNSGKSIISVIFCVLQRKLLNSQHHVQIICPNDPFEIQFSIVQLRICIQRIIIRLRTPRKYYELSSDINLQTFREFFLCLINISGNYSLERTYRHTRNSDVSKGNSNKQFRKVLQAFQ